MIDDGGTVTLADFPACIGHDSTRGSEHGCILLKEAGDKVMGFVVSGELRTQSISPDLIFPMPDYLKTRVFDTCAVHDGIPIPIISIAEFYSGVLKAGAEPFAVPAAGIEDQAVRPDATTRRVFCSRKPFRRKSLRSC